MNIDSTALNAIVVAEEIGLFADCPQWPEHDGFSAAVDATILKADDAVDSTISATAAGAVANLPPVAAVAATNLPLLADNEFDSGKGNNSAAGAQREGESSAAAATVHDVVSDVVSDVVLGYLIEGINDVEWHIRHHAILFYQKLIPVFEEASAQFFLISQEKNNTIIGSLKHIQDGQPLSSLRCIYPNIHHWNKTYSIIANGVGGHTLVMRPKFNSANDQDDGEYAIPVEEMKRITYLEQVLIDLQTVHGDDHRKVKTFHSSLDIHWLVCTLHSWSVLWTDGYLLHHHSTNSVSQTSSNDGQTQLEDL
jgi:hypothetical protein